MIDGQHITLYTCPHNFNYNYYNYRYLWFISQCKHGRCYDNTICNSPDMCQRLELGYKNDHFAPITFKKSTSRRVVKMRCL